MAAPVVSDEISMASQCVAFCQTLTSQDKAFSFALKIGESFSFSLDTKEKISAHVPVPKTRKLSPSTMRRNALRRQNFLESKNKAAANIEALATPDDKCVVEKPLVSCQECGHTSQTTGGMKLSTH